MKPFFKHFILPLMLLTVGTIACNNAKQQAGDTTENNTGTENHDSHDHVHTYACPMHPEMQGHEGEKCNICGMPLEHMDHVPVAGNYMMDIKPSTDMIKAGIAVDLSLTPKNKDNMSLSVPLDVEHEKKIHLIAVSEDLSWFDHIHPEYQTDGSYLVKETFPHGGKYLLYADYKPSGSTHQLEQFSLQVIGKSKSPIKSELIKMTAISSDFSVTLKPENGIFLAYQEGHFDVQFTRKSKPFSVNDLQSYLGAKGHMVAIHIPTKTYVHLHPEVENDNLHFHSTFPAQGMYRAWLQFSMDNKIHTVDFTIMVEKGEGVGPQDSKVEEQQSDHQH